MSQRLTDLTPGTPTLASLLWFADMTQPAGSRDRVATLQAVAAVLGIAIGYVDDSDPGVTNDETEGYGRLSLGLNTSTEALFVCVDPSEGAAVWVPLTAGGQQVYDVQMGSLGEPPDGHEDAFVAPRAFTILTADPAEVAVLTNPTDGTATIDVEVNGTPVGDIQITTGGVATVTLSADLELDPGDVLTLIFPSPADSTLAGVLVGWRGALP